ncbi:MAG: RIP metalloprotease RseP [Rikenellaceae bacterium]
METIVKIVQLILSLSLLVIIHEFGHFIFAKIFKCRVEKFYLFFDYKYSIFKRNFRGTEFGIGWIPFGGYVKISGMVDESMDKKQLAEAPKEWEFRAKPAWQRMFIIIGGVMMNVILAVVIYICMTWAWGDQYVKTSDIPNGYTYSEVAKDMGFRNGDKILSVDGAVIENYAAIAPAIIFADNRVVEVEREGVKQTITVSDSMIKRMLKDPLFLSLRLPARVVYVDEGSAAEEALFAVGDQIISLNGSSIEFIDQFTDGLAQRSSDSICVGVMRGADTVMLSAVVNGQGKIGVGFDGNIEGLYPISMKEYTLWEAIPEGISRGYNKIGEYIQQLKLIFNPETEAYKEVGGFIAMGKIFPSSWNWVYFWNITALLSIMLAVMNILPIPGLDGGHLIFILYEMITRRAPSQKFMEYAQYAGFIIIIALVVVVNASDLFKLLF